MGNNHGCCFIISILIKQLQKKNGNNWFIKNKSKIGNRLFIRIVFNIISAICLTIAILLIVISYIVNSTQVFTVAIIYVVTLMIIFCLIIIIMLCKIRDFDDVFLTVKQFKYITRIVFFHGILWVITFVIDLSLQINGYNQIISWMIRCIIVLSGAFSMYFVNTYWYAI